MGARKANRGEEREGQGKVEEGRRGKHRSRIRYLGKKNSRILTNFWKFKKFVKIRTKKWLNARVGVAFQQNSLLICIISNKLTTTTEEFDAFHGFMLIKI